jgi:hypothetical protein
MTLKSGKTNVDPKQESAQHHVHVKVK